MILGISNLAWEDFVDLSILTDNGIKCVEIVIPKHLVWRSNNLEKLVDFTQRLGDEGIIVLSTQSILYGSGIGTFSDKEFGIHMQEVSKVCETIGVSKLVLGAPNSRKNKGDGVGLINNFSYIDSILRQREQILLIEPNTRTYGGEYFHTVCEIRDFISENGFTNIKTMIDTHNCVFEEEDPCEAFIRNQVIVEHVHVSEVGLSDFHPSEVHEKLARTLKEHEYGGLVIYEAKPSINLVNSLRLFNQTYNI